MPIVKPLRPPIKKISAPRQRTVNYTTRWDNFAKRYRRANPFCAECERMGRLTYTKVVDHKRPVSDGGEMFPGLKGVWGLCVAHHGWKAALEQYARDTDQMDMIVTWCDEPATRPRVAGEVL